MKRVLVPTDFSAHADRALTVAIGFAKPLGATIDLVHVYASPMPIVASIGGAVPPPPPLTTPDDLMNIQRRIDERADKVRNAGLECSSAIVEGPAAAEIVSQSRKIGADLIVMPEPIPTTRVRRSTSTFRPCRSGRRSFGFASS